MKTLLNRHIFSFVLVTVLVSAQKSSWCRKALEQLEASSILLNNTLAWYLHLIWAAAGTSMQQVSRMRAEIRVRLAFGMHLVLQCNFSVCLLSLNLKPQTVISILLVSLQSKYRGERMYLCYKCSPKAVEKTLVAL